MVNFTVQHILIMRLLTQFNFPSTRYLHTLLFLSSSSNLERHAIGFYDFVRTAHGVFSFSLQAIIQELFQGELVNRETLKLTEKGHNAYFALARVLVPFEDYWSCCVDCFNYHADYKKMQNSLRTNVMYRKARVNGDIFSVQ